MPKKHPPVGMIQDLATVFQKHNWSGLPVGVQAADESDDTQCPAGTTPQTVTYQLPDGTWETRTICA